MKKLVRFNRKNRLINTISTTDKYKNKTILRMAFLKKVCKNYLKY
jgi:hypothetical protein